MPTRLTVPLAALVAAVLAAGCQQTPQAGSDASAEPAVVETAPPAVVETPAAEPVVVPAGDYDRIFDATVDVLRDWRFVVDRRDRRFGIVSTRPQVAATVFEPWRPDLHRTGRAGETTMNHERRTVRVALVPNVPGASDGVAPVLPDLATGTYRLEVTARVDRRHIPPRQLNTAAVPKITSATANDRTKPIYTETGRVESYWTPVTRDAEFERQLAAAILTRAAAPRSDTATTESPATP